MEKIFECIKDCKRMSENMKPYKKGDAMSLNEKEAKTLRKEGVIGQFDGGKSESGKEPVKPTAKKKAAKKK